MPMEIKVLKAGPLTSIQDLGRRGYRDAGVPVSGAMDTFAARIANVLVGNSPVMPVLEFTYGDAHLMAVTDLIIAHCGGGSGLVIANNVVASWKPVFVCAGTNFSLKSTKAGCRSYLSIAGGWCAQKVMNSYSTYLPLGIGGTGGVIERGDLLSSQDEMSVLSWSLLAKLQLQPHDAFKRCYSSFRWGVYPASLINYGSKVIRVIAGHEYDWYTDEMQKLLFKQQFTISTESDRMGYRLQGEAISAVGSRQLLSTAGQMGTIQVTSGGTLILLMADCQTTGGYPRIAQVAAVDLPVCAQLKPGDKIQFRKISLQEAEDAFVQLEILIQDLQTQITQKFISN